ncbi:hypothetical protein H9P43_009235 [Blastocladiella emersonii ATCC 22665]|nr:hypothetical protein H9P43_009235 [Blastocladiella emersonii ATCC 22665]
MNAPPLVHATSAGPPPPAQAAVTKLHALALVYLHQARAAACNTAYLVQPVSAPANESLAPASAAHWFRLGVACLESASRSTAAGIDAPLALENRLLVVRAVAEFAPTDAAAAQLALTALARADSLAARLPVGADRRFELAQARGAFLTASGRAAQAIPVLTSAVDEARALGRVGWSVRLAVQAADAMKWDAATGYWRTAVLPACQAAPGECPVLALDATLRLAHRALADPKLKSMADAVRSFAALADYFDQIAAGPMPAGLGGVPPRPLVLHMKVLRVLAAVAADDTDRAAVLAQEMLQLANTPTTPTSGDTNVRVSEDGAAVEVTVTDLSMPLLPMDPTRPRTSRLRLGTLNAHELNVAVFLAAGCVNAPAAAGARARAFYRRGYVYLLQNFAAIRVPELQAVLLHHLFDMSVAVGDLDVAAECLEQLAYLPTPSPTYALHLALGAFYTAANLPARALAHYDAALSDPLTPRDARDLASLHLALLLRFALDDTPAATRVLDPVHPTHPALAAVRSLLLATATASANTAIVAQKQQVLSALRDVAAHALPRTLALALAGTVYAGTHAAGDAAAAWASARAAAGEAVVGGSWADRRAE